MATRGVDRRPYPFAAAFLRIDGCGDGAPEYSGDSPARSRASGHGPRGIRRGPGMGVSSGVEAPRSGETDAWTLRTPMTR